MAEVRRPDTTCIYALCEPGVDPNDPATWIGQIRYVGKTNNPKKRRWDHEQPHGANVHRVNWIRTLRSRGQRPVLVILEECLMGAWREREVYWYGAMKARGERLINVVEGGHGCLPHDVTEETRRRISAATRAAWERRRAEGRIHPELSAAGRKRIGEAASAKWKQRWEARRATGWKPSAEQLEKMRQTMLARYKESPVRVYEGFVPPECTEPIGPVGNLALFCRENGLSNHQMRRVYYGKRIQHKGWTCCRPEAIAVLAARPVDPILSARALAREARQRDRANGQGLWEGFVDPEGNAVSPFANLNAWARERGLQASLLGSVYTGRRRRHKDYTHPAAWSAAHPEQPTLNL